MSRQLQSRQRGSESASRGVSPARWGILVVSCGLLAPVAEGPARGAEPAREGLVLEYRFDGNAADSSGNRRDGTVHGGPQFVPGKNGQCLALDGQDDYIDCGATLAELGQSFTVECWVRPADTQNMHADIFGNHAHGGFGFVVEQDGTNTNRFAGAYGAGSGRWVGTRPVALPPGKWRHLALVKTPGELRLYLNGVPVVQARSDAPMLPSTLTLRVGDSIGEIRRCFRGQIDDFRVWKKALAEFDLGLSPEETTEAFAQALQIALRPGRPGQDGTSWTLSVEDPFARSVPEVVQEIVLAMEAEEWRSGNPVGLPPVRLARQAGFRAEFVPSLKPGYYRVRCMPSLVVGQRQVSGRPEEFSCAVHGASSAAVPIPAGAAPHWSGKDRFAQVCPLDGEGWRIAIDPKNEGKQRMWPASPVNDARPTKVPGVIQDVFPDYHGVAWYWREFVAPPHFQPEGRYLLRFHAVDYLAEVWVNGQPVGGHEGGETPFVLDATRAVRPGEKNLLAVRVLNPTYEPIDGIALKQTPSGAKQYPVATNAAYNCGGIVDSAELLVSPAVRIEDLHVSPDWKTGEIRIRADVRNASARPVRGCLRFEAAPAAGGTTSGSQTLAAELPPGETGIEGRLRVEHHRLWQLNDPFLYRATARVQAEAGDAADERSVRFGFRDFRFENGCFRLNGRRVFLHGVIHLAHYPIAYTWPADLDWMRRDVLHMKAAGVNLCRFSFGGSLARQLDVFDELGVMVCMEHYANWQLQDGPQIRRRYERSLGEIVLRDRNHPSIVAWGMLNETGASDPAFRHGVQSLPLVRWLDPGRMCVLNSGRWDADPALGSLSNPGSPTWDGLLRDSHGYPPAPHPAGLLRSMRTGELPDGFSGGGAPALPPGSATRPLFVSEYGQCGAIDLLRTVRRYEQLGKEQADDARFYRRQLDKFLADWRAWRLDRIWPRPEDFFLESHANFVKLRRIGENALRANPHLVAFSSTYPIAETGFCGSGLANTFRELKPGLMDAAFDLAAPLRWCLFAEPTNVYRGARVKLDAVLANEDMLPPGKHPVRLQVIGPDGQQRWEKRMYVEVPPRGGKGEPPFALPVAAEEIVADGPPGRHRFLATLLEGGAPGGGQTDFYVDDSATMPRAVPETAIWGDDPPLGRWLAQAGIRARPFAAGSPAARRVVIASGRPPAPGGSAAFAELAREIARGSVVLFLDPGMFGDGQNPTRWLPLKQKGLLGPIDWVGGYYRGDVWAKSNPVFEGLPAGGLMDPVFYREILPPQAFLRCHTVGRGFIHEEHTVELDAPDEAICGTNRLSANYASGLHVAAYRLGAGRFVLCTLLIRENLGQVPAAERLLRNLLLYAGSDLAKPPADLFPGFEAHLKAIGYQP